MGFQQGREEEILQLSKVLTGTTLHSLRSSAEFQLDDYHELLRNFDWSTIVGLAYSFRE